MRKRVAFFAAFYLALGAANLQALADEAHRMKAGETFSVSNKENPSTGYIWSIDSSASAGLDLLAISDGGHKTGKSLPGAPGTHSWTIRALKPGTATIQFVYQRPWEPAPAQTRRMVLEISP